MIKFHTLVPTEFPPHPASRSANGTLPIDGFRYCEPLRLGSGFGWHVHLPMDLWLHWDGAETEWSIDEGQTWYPLAQGIQYPGFAREFDAHAPEGCQGYAPPFIAKGADHDVLQIWTGVIAKTQPGTHLLVRGPSNLSWRTDYSVMEGVVETDRWFGPLFTNIRLRKSGSPIILRRFEPLLQVQPVAAEMMAQVGKEHTEISEGAEAMTPADWAAFHATVVHRVETRTRLGDYAKGSRKIKKAAG